MKAVQFRLLSNVSIVSGLVPDSQYLFCKDGFNEEAAYSNNNNNNDILSSTVVTVNIPSHQSFQRERLSSFLCSCGFPGVVKKTSKEID